MTASYLKQYWLKHCSVTAIHFMADHHLQNSVFHPDSWYCYSILCGDWVSSDFKKKLFSCCVSFCFVWSIAWFSCFSWFIEWIRNWMNESDEPSLQVPVASDWCQVWGWYGVGWFLIVISCDSWSQKGLREHMKWTTWRSFVSLFFLAVFWFEVLGCVGCQDSIPLLGNF